ncbi:MAG: hypothetical protein AAF696_13795 [Bacteroidota bacterium]
MTYFLTLVSTLPISYAQASTVAYAITYMICAIIVHRVLIQRAGEELGRKTVDAIFFVMVGAGSLIWFLSKIPPIS